MDSMVENVMQAVLTPENLSSISSSVGGDETKVKSALEMGVPMIMGALSDKSSTAGGADMITQMLGQMGGDNPMDNIAGFLGGSGSSGGSNMVSSLLGSQMGTISNAIAQKTGLPPAVVKKVLEIATPIIIGQLGKTMGGSVDKAGLSSLLGEQSKMAMQSNPEAAALAGQLLSQAGGPAGVMGSLKKIFGK